MTLLKSVWKSVVLASIAGVLMFAGGAFATSHTATWTVGTNGSLASAKSGAADITSGTNNNVSDAEVFVLSVAPGSGYVVDAWTLSIGSSNITGDSLTALLNPAKTVLTVPADQITDDITAGVTFKATTPHTATWTVGTNGAFSSAKSGTTDITSGTNNNVNDGANFVLTVTANSGYTVDAWTLSIGSSNITGASLIALLNSAKTVLTVPADQITDDITAGVTFKAATPHTATWTIGTNGTLSSAKSGTTDITSGTNNNVNDGANFVLTVAANSGYTVDTWTLSIGSSNITGTPLTNMLNEAKTVLTVPAAQIIDDITAAVTFKVGTTNTPTITVKPVTQGDGTVDIPGTPPTIVQYVGNITARLNVAVNQVLNAPITFEPATGLQYTWYLITDNTVTDPANVNFITGNGKTKNATMVKSTATAGNNGTFFQLPEDLQADSLSPTDIRNKSYKYIATITATIAGTDVVGRSNIVTITVKPRPKVSLALTPAAGTDGVTLTLEEAKNITATSRTLNVLPTVSWGAATADSKTGTVKYVWSWTNKNGTGGGVLSGSPTYLAEITNAAGVQTAGNDYVVPNGPIPTAGAPSGTGLPAGVYYFRCEVTYGVATTPTSGAGFVGLSIPVKTGVVTVVVTPPASATTTSAIPVNATINIADVTTLDYQLVTGGTDASGGTITSSGSNNTGGRKLFVTIPTSNLVTGFTMPGTVKNAFAATFVQYKKIAPTTNTAHDFTSDITLAGTDYGKDGKFNFGVKNAGTYEVLVKVIGSSETGTTTKVETQYVGWKKVLLVVKPKNLSTIAANSFSVKAPTNDTIYNGRSKTPFVEIKDGTYTLKAGTDYKVNPPSKVKDWVDAGTASVTVSGCAEELNTSDDLCTAIGGGGEYAAYSDANYTGDRLGSFIIRRMPLAINTVASTVTGKKYDGTDTLGAGNITVAFNPQPVEAEFSKGVDYIVSGAKFDNKDVGTSRTVGSITVKLDETNSALAKNYTFGAVNAAAVLSTSFSKSGVAITKQTPDAAFLKYSIPTTHRYNGLARGIGAVDWKTGVTNPGQAAFEVFYATGLNPPTKDLPKGETGNVTGPDVPAGSVAVDYVVSVSVRGGSNFNDGVIYFKKANGEDTTYTIGSRAKLDSVTTRPKRKGDDDVADTTVYVGMSLALKATAVRPDSVSWKVYGDDGKVIQVKNADGDLVDSIFRIKYKGGNIAYQWFKVPTSVSAASGLTDDTKWDSLKTSSSAKTDTYTLPLPLKETKGETKEFYQVRAIWSYPNVTIPDTAFITTTNTVTRNENIDAKNESTRGAHRAIGVKIGPEPKSLADAEITVGGSYPYTGEIYVVDSSLVTVTITGDDGQVKSLKVRTETEPGDFTMTSYGLNAGKGAGTVTITGINAYKGTAIGYFDIDQITTDESWLVFGTTKQYNDSIQEFSVTPRTGLSGLGKVNRVYMTAKDGAEDAYDTLPGAPKAVGSYMVSVKIDEGINFTAMDEFKKPFYIVKRVLTKADFAYNFPEEHAFTGVAVPLVTATLNASVKGYTKGYKVVILTGNTETDLTEMPTAEGAYKIYISVEGDDNFANAMVLLGTYQIHEAGWVGVKGSDRVIPVKPEVKVVTVAPVKVAAAVTFTAGPSPVSKANGKIAFFSSKSVKSGSLYIFDASGNAVAKLSAKSGSGEIASWNLKDKKGSAVAEGSYVVKGALAGKDGTREKVSFVFSVVK